MKEEIVQSFYTPKLTEEELKLVEDENIDYEKTFRFGFYSCEEAKWEMKQSDSNSKYVHGYCIRWTYSLTLAKKKMGVKNCCNII